MAEILNSKYGIYIITAFLFLGMAFILRFLFGPKGIFRDPYWDESNARIRSEEEKEKAEKEKNHDNLI